MARGVSIDILRVDVGAMLHKGLDNSKISSDAGDVQWCSEVVCPCIDLCAELDQDLNHGCMALACSQMEWSEAI